MPPMQPAIAKESVDDTLLYKDDTQTSLKEALCNRKLWKISMYGMLIAFAFRLPAIVMPILGANYFESDEHDNDNTAGCNSKGNATYAMWFSLFSCIGGAVGFLFESYLGRLSDERGRKPIMYFTWAALFIGNTCMCFTDNVWFYLVLFPVSSLAGLFAGMPTVLASALSDCVVPKYKTTIFAFLFGLAGIVSIIGSVVSALLTSFISIKAPFFAFSITMILALLWLVFIVDETLPKESRTTHDDHAQTAHCQALRALCRIGENKVILWVSVMALVASIPESGIDDMIGSYTDDILSLCDNDSKAAQFNAMSGITMGVVMLISQLCVLPILAAYFSDVFLFVFVLFAVLCFMASGIIAYLFPSTITGLLIWACFGLSFITSPVTNGCLAKRLSAKEQGLGMGILHAMKGLTFCIAPYTFGGLYDLFAEHGILKTMPFMLGIVCVLIGVVILFGPLKSTLNAYDDEKLRKGLVPVADVHVQQK